MPRDCDPGALNLLEEQFKQVFGYRQSGLNAFKHSVDHCYNIKQQSPQEGNLADFVALSINCA